MTKQFSPMQKLAAVFGIVLASCGVPLMIVTSKLSDQSGLARMEWEAGRRSIASKDRCAEAALAGVKAAQRLSTYPGRVSKETAEKIESDVSEACKVESPTHGQGLGHDLGGHPVDASDRQQDAASRG